MTGKITGTGITIFLITALMLMLTTPVLAASAGVSPASITLNATQGESYTIKFAAVNTGNDTTDYSIYARGNITNWTFFNVTKVTLLGKKAYPTDAIITIPKDLPDGVYKGDIIIKSIPEQSKSGNMISLKVNLPITINVSRPPQNPLIWATGILVTMIIIGIIEIKRRQKNEQKKPDGILDN